MYNLTEEQIEKIRMMSIPILVASDLHLKRRTWTNWPELSGDAYRALSDVASIHQTLAANNINIKNMLLCGDTFDSNMVSSSDICYLSALTNYIAQQGTTYYIRGNHDSIEPSYVSAVPGTTELSEADPVVFDDDEAYLWGIPYVASREQLLAKLSVISDYIKLHDIRKPIYIAMHQAFQHVIDIDFAFQLSSSDVEALFDRPLTILVGHIHKLDCRALSGPCSGGSIISIGSLYPTAWEVLPVFHGVHILDLANGERVPINIMVRDYVCMEPTDATAMQEAFDRITEYHNPGMEPTAVRVVLPEAVTASEATAIAASYPYLRARFGRTAADSAPVRHAHSPSPGIYTILDAVKDDLKANNPANWEQLFVLASDILGADDPADYLGRLLSAWLDDDTTEENPDDNAVEDNA